MSEAMTENMTEFITMNMTKGKTEGVAITEGRTIHPLELSWRGHIHVDMTIGMGGV